MFEARRQKIAERVVGPSERIFGVWGVNVFYAYVWTALGIFISFLAFITFASQEAFLVGSIFIALFGYGYSLLLLASHVYILTDKRAISIFQFLSRSVVEVEFSKITDVQVRESFFDRLIFKDGNVLINTAGTHSEEIVFQHISNPQEIRKQLNELRSGKVSI